MKVLCWKRVLCSLLIVLLLFTLGNGCQSSTSQQTPTGQSASSIEIKGFAFNPSELTVSKGATVTWTNNDPVTHTVTADDQSFSMTLDSGKSYSKTFDTPGTYSYHCSIHPSMTGKIIVQ